MYCANCGQEILSSCGEFQAPNDGKLYVAEDMEDSTEYFNGVDEYGKCDECCIYTYKGLLE